MKPADLKSPFTWKERRIVVEDRVWYVPGQFNDFASFTFPGWDHPSFFGQNRPICLEFCSGNGAWIAAKAQSEAAYHWVGIELKFERVRKIWSKVKNFQLSNLLVVCGEGYSVAHHFIPSGSIHAVYVNFPDPWPKRRHAKNRLIQVPFVQEIHRMLEAGGVLTIVTDDISHSKYILRILEQHQGFESIYKDPFYLTEYPDYGTSYFEDLWREKGKEIRYHAFRKKEKECCKKEDE